MFFLYKVEVTLLNSSIQKKHQHILEHEVHRLTY